MTKLCIPKLIAPAKKPSRDVDPGGRLSPSKTACRAEKFGLDLSEIMTQLTPKWVSFPIFYEFFRHLRDAAKVTIDFVSDDHAGVSSTYTRSGDRRRNSIEPMFARDRASEPWPRRGDTPPSGEGITTDLFEGWPRIFT